MRNKFLNVALENEELENEMDAVEVDAEVTEGVNEIVEEQGEIEELNDGVDSAVSDLDTLEQIEGKMEESVESGEGISEDAAEIAEIAIESIGRRLGIPMNVMPAMESFGSSSSRKRATQIALEGIGDTIKKIWTYIRDGFKRMWTSIKDFFGRFFENSEKVRKQAEALRKTANERAGWNVKEKDVKVGASTATLLSVKGKYTKANLEVLQKNHEGITNQLVNLNDVLGQTVSSLNEYIKLAKDGKATRDKLDTTMAEQTATISKMMSDKISITTSKPNSKGSTISVGPFVGGDMIDFTINKKNDAVTGVSLTTVEGEKNSSDNLPGVKSEEIAAICDQIISLTKTTEEFKKAQSGIKKLNEDFIGLADQAVKFAETVAGTAKDADEVVKAINLVRSPVTQLSNFSTRMITMTPAWNVKLAKGMLSYASACLKNLEEKK